MRALRAMRGWWLPLIWLLLAISSMARGRLLYGLVFLCVAVVLIADQEAKRRGREGSPILRAFKWIAGFVGAATAAYILWRFTQEL